MTDRELESLEQIADKIRGKTHKIEVHGHCSKIELVVRKRDILAAEAGLREACEILFPEDAEVRLQEYLAELRDELPADQQVA